MVTNRNYSPDIHNQRSRLEIVLDMPAELQLATAQSLLDKEALRSAYSGELLAAVLKTYRIIDYKYSAMFGVSDMQARVNAAWESLIEELERKGIQRLPMRGHAKPENLHVILERLLVD